MVKEAEENASEDKAKREMVDAKNQADSIIHATEQSLTEHGDKISDSEKSDIEAAVADLKTAVEGDDLDDIRTKTEALGQASMKLGEAVYAAQQAEQGEAGPTPEDMAAAGSTGPADDDIVDADFEEVDDDKKDAS